MADGQEDFSSLPLPDRFAHKVSCLLPAAVAITRITLTVLPNLELESQKGGL